MTRIPIIVLWGMFSYTNYRLFLSNLGHRMTVPSLVTKKKYICPEETCKHKTFSRKADLGRHSLTHTGERPFECRFEGCNRVGKRAFPRRDKLVDHQRKVHKATRDERRACHLIASIASSNLRVQILKFNLPSPWPTAKSIVLQPDRIIGFRIFVQHDSHHDEETLRRKFHVYIPANASTIGVYQLVIVYPSILISERICLSLPGQK